MATALANKISCIPNETRKPALENKFDTGVTILIPVS